MAPVWYYWPDAEARPGPANMAVDQALLELAGEEGLAVLRVYRWQPHTLSFGRNEPTKGFSTMGATKSPPTNHGSKASDNDSIGGSTNSITP